MLHGVCRSRHLTAAAVSRVGPHCALHARDMIPRSQPVDGTSCRRCLRRRHGLMGAATCRRRLRGGGGRSRCGSGRWLDSGILRRHGCWARRLVVCQALAVHTRRLAAKESLGFHPAAAPLGAEAEALAARRGAAHGLAVRRRRRVHDRAHAFALLDGEPCKLRKAHPARRVEAAARSAQGVPVAVTAQHRHCGGKQQERQHRGGPHGCHVHAPRSTLLSSTLGI
mmetsp:Transcript_6102/g.16500  ORF Transcript_6102/g.16500 Transcript_6102/m.16500 type:complete len:225 (+) Transcript_6102:834-1508(+)